MLAAIIAWLVLAVMICAIGTRMLCALYIVCSVGLYILYKLLVANVDIVGGNQESATHMRNMLNSMFAHIQKNMIDWLPTTGKLHALVKRNAETLTRITTHNEYLESIVFSKSGIRNTIGEIIPHPTIDMATVCKWLLAYIQSSMPVPATTEHAEYNQHELFGGPVILRKNLNIAKCKSKHPIFGYGLFDMSPPEQIADNHIWDTYLDIQRPICILCVGDTPRQNILDCKDDFSIFPLQTYSYVSRRVCGVMIDMYTRNLMCDMAEPGNLVQLTASPVNNDTAALYKYLPMTDIPASTGEWPRMGMRATIADRQYRQLYTQRLRASYWSGYFDYVIKLYSQKSSDADAPPVYEYIIDLAIGSKNDLTEINSTIDMILSYIYVYTDTPAVDDIDARINSIDSWLKMCGDNLDAIVCHDHNYTSDEKQAKIIGHSTTPENFDTVVQSMHKRAALVVRRYRSMPKYMIDVLCGEYKFLSEADVGNITRVVEKLLRGHTSVTSNIVPFTVVEGTNRVETKETYVWIIGNIRWMYIGNIYPQVSALVCKYIERKYNYVGNMDEIYNVVDTLLPKNIYTTPTADIWERIGKYCKSFANRENEPVVDTIENIQREHTLDLVRDDTDKEQLRLAEEAEQKRLAEEGRLAEEEVVRQRHAAALRILVEKQTANQKLAEQKRLVEEQRRKEEQQAKKQQRLKEDQQAEQTRLVEEQRLKEEQRRAFEQAEAEQQRLVEEQAKKQRLKEEQQAEQRRAEKQRLKEEQRRDEKQRLKEEQRRALEQAGAEQQWLVEEQAKKQRLKEEQQATKQQLEEQQAEQRRVEKQRLKEEQRWVEKQRLKEEQQAKKQQQLEEQRRLEEQAAEAKEQRHRARQEQRRIADQRRIEEAAQLAKKQRRPGTEQERRRRVEESERQAREQFVLQAKEADRERQRQAKEVAENRLRHIMESERALRREKEAAEQRRRAEDEQRRRALEERRHARMIADVAADDDRRRQAERVSHKNTIYRPRENVRVTEPLTYNPHKNSRQALEYARNIVNNKEDPRRRDFDAVMRADQEYDKKIAVPRTEFRSNRPVYEQPPDDGRNLYLDRYEQRAFSPKVSRNVYDDDDDDDNDVPDRRHADLIAYASKVIKRQ